MSVVDIGMNQHYEPVGIYAEGFLDAAMGLFERAARGEGLADFTVYPAVYSLRHGIELFVKQMSIYVAYEHRDEGRLYEPGHNLADAWQKIRSDVYGWSEYTPPQEEDIQDQLNTIDAALAAIHNLDPNGTVFRYPEYVKAATKNKPRIREDKPPPIQIVDYAKWTSLAENVLEAVRGILYVAHESASGLAQQRGDPDTNFHALVMSLSKAKPSQKPAPKRAPEQQKKKKP